MMDKQTERALKEIGGRFHQFARNGRWGTCVDCPRTDGHVYPEFCKHTDRYDHQLTLGELAEGWYRRVPRIVVCFLHTRTESPSDNIRIKFDDGSEFYTSTRLRGFDGYNCVRKLFPQLCSDSSEFKGPFESQKEMAAAVVGAQLTQEQHKELMSHNI